jgi:predicted kinase
MTTWVLLAGLPGTGKSTLATALADRLSAVILDKDRVRDALFPGPATDYSAEQDQVAAQAMLQSAHYLTAKNRASYIFFDGRTFSSRARIDEVIEAAEQAGAHWRILHLTCTDAVAEQRLANTDPTHPAKNRDIQLYRRVQQSFEPIVRPKYDIDTTAGIAEALKGAQAYLEQPTR